MRTYRQYCRSEEVKVLKGALGTREHGVLKEVTEILSEAKA